jgi:hypothetical protein
VLETVCEELYIEEQQELDKDKREGDHILGTGVPYPPININVLPSHSIASRMNTSLDKATIDLKAIGPLEIPGPRDEAIKKYGKWQASNATNDTLKATFRQM